jgi:hypothetical protein
VDQTLHRGKSEADLWSQLLPLCRTVNVHTPSRLADSRCARRYLMIRGGNQSNCLTCSPKRKAIRRCGQIHWTPRDLSIALIAIGTVSLIRLHAYTEVFAA